MGISDSARVALVIFVLHIGTLVPVFSVDSCQLRSCSHVGNQPANLVATKKLGEIAVLGFSAAMLGVSGFESSSNFVEQQRPGVFRLTLRNMWVAVTSSIPSLRCWPLAYYLSPTSPNTRKT